MERLQVRFCKGEEELNRFLMTLHLDRTGYPHLQSINYVAEVNGHGRDYETDSGTKTEIDMGSTVIAAVQYFVEVDDD